jgi:hypothetical protein
MLFLHGYFSHLCFPFLFADLGLKWPVFFVFTVYLRSHSLWVMREHTFPMGAAHKLVPFMTLPVT